jgi:hypothetical protein
VAAVVTAAWLIVAHFKSPTTDFGVAHDSGVAAIVEQAFAAIAFLAYLFIPVSYLRVVFVAFQFWPVVALSCGSWHSFPRWGRAVVFGYSCLALIIGFGLWIWLHFRWHVLFFSP